MESQKLKQGKAYSKTVMYWFDYSRDITVEERQTNNTLDRVVLHYTVRDGGKAYFSEEYRPVGMPKEGTSGVAPDIDDKEGIED